MERPSELVGRMILLQRYPMGRGVGRLGSPMLLHPSHFSFLSRHEMLLLRVKCPPFWLTLTQASVFVDITLDVIDIVVD